MSQAAVDKQPSLEGRLDLFKDEGGQDIFAKAHKFVEADMARQMNIYPCYQTLERNEGPTAIIKDKEVLMMGSNNYLGLTIDSRVRQASIDAIEKYGTSLTGSRLLNGTHRLHEELESDLAKFLGKEASLVFSTGYQANLGVLSALVNKNDVLIMDKGDHASIYDGSKLAKGEVIGFNHNDMKDLERVLKEIPEGKGKMVIVDGVFSMEGDIAKLPEIVQLCEKYKARLVVDDAHSVGVLGKMGRGTADHFGLTDKVDLIVGTFSKSLASVGGFVAGDEKIIDFIRHFGRPMIFSASLPPSSVAAAKKALEIMQAEPHRVARVNANGDYMRRELKALGFNIGHSETPVIPIVIGDELKTLQIWRELLDAGIYVNVALYPAVPRDMSLLRTSYTSEHTREHLDKALSLFKMIKEKYDI